MAVLITAAFLLAFGTISVLLGRDAWKARSAEGRYREGTTAAYVGTAELDLKLARQRIAGDDLEAGEARLARAEDKLNSPRSAGLRSVDARVGLGDLQGRYAAQLKPVRRKRVMDRLAKEGAEK